MTTLPQPQSAQPARRVRPWLACMALLLWAALPSFAMETSSAASSALRVLSLPLGDQSADMKVAESSSDKAPPAEQAETEARITVQKGESIDAVIRRGLPGLPLKEDFLRRALAKANPKVFPKGQTYPVRAGTVLLLPSPEQLRSMMLAQYPEASILFKQDKQESTTPEPQHSPSNKSRWVRFP